jgi:hypothetical protein
MVMPKNLNEGDSMIISASRRTDIPALYSEWFMNRIKDRYVLVRNPMNSSQVSRIDLSPEVVDGIVFWTKNPLPMIDKLDALKVYVYYFQFTLTSYGSDVESNVPSKNDVIIPAFQRLADKIGPERVIWRYDPIFLSEKYTVRNHIKSFDRIARQLEGYTKKCTISFIDYYRNTRNNIKDIKLLELTDDSKYFLARYLSESARSHGVKIDTCAESIDLQKYDITHARCIDDKLFEKLLGCSLNIEKDKSQRLECGCASSIDIGAYNSCRNGCKYCYANHSLKTVISNNEKYDPYSPILCGSVSADERITDRPVRSNRSGQLNMFEDCL